MKNTQVARLLAYVTGMVNRQLLLQNEYLIAENRILPNWNACDGSRSDVRNSFFIPWLFGVEL
jgi:hypothetical protein